jgi:TonB dependent receptor/Carboxypeptidase regulatory-like domain
MNPRLQISIAVFLTAAAAFAQVAAIQGTVTDPTGAAVAGASVSLRRASGHGPALASITSDNGGRFRFERITPERYRIHVEAGEAFDVLDRAITVSSADTKPFVLRLSIRRFQQSVEVTADDEKPSIDTGANLDRTTVSAAVLDQLPVFDQDYIGAMQQFLDPASIATGGVTITVDGMEVTRATVPKSAVQQITINDDPYSAESNRPGHGRIDVITKPGGGRLHGSLNYSFRNSNLAARSYFAPEKTPEQRQAYEGLLTGAVPHDRSSSFLFSFSRSVADAAAVVHAVTPSGPFDQSVSAPSTRMELMGRVSHDWNERDRSSLQLNWERTADLLQGVGGTVLPEAAVNSHSREFDAFFTLHSMLSPTRFNRFQFTVEVNREPTGSVSTAPAIIVRDAFAAGGAQSTLLRTESGGKINDILTLSRKNQVIELGVQIPNLNKRVYDDQTNQGGTFTFLTLADYEAHRPYEYTVQQGTTRVGFWWREYGAFVQDQINVTPNLHASLGLRYDWQAFFHDSNNFSPRASVAWAPHAAGKLVVRAGGGLFYDRSGVSPIASLLLHNGHTLRSYTILNPSYPDPFAGGTSLADIPTNITEVAPDIQIPYTFQYGASVERQLSKSTSAVVGYRASRGHHLFRSVDVNAPLPPDYATIPDPALGHVQQIRSDGRMKSDALELTLRGRAGKILSGQLQYTYSRAMSDTGGIFWYPSNQYAPLATEWGPTDFDVRHRLNILATLNAGRWGKLGAAGKFSSAPPYTLTAGEDLFHTGLSNARPGDVGRNGLRGSRFSDVDLRWSHELPVAMGKTKGHGLALSVDAFNLFNRPNFSGYVGNVRSPLYLDPTKAGPGRRLQLSVEATFGEE